ncbi:MAG: NADH-quinone oxidoreductase subunit C [Patescibacteria group bacterium]
MITHRTTTRDAFGAEALVYTNDGARLLLMFATDNRKDAHVYRVNALFMLSTNELIHLSTEVPEDNPAYPSLTRHIMAAHWYERQMMDQFGIIAEGHPDPRRLYHHENIPLGTYPMRKDFAWNTKLAHAQVPYPMHQVEGKGVYEIPVGPIHAGIIEPGHFRFNVRGERIITLEGKLFFKHKGVEKLVEGKTPEEALPFVERVSGDMVVGHTLAYVQAVERASGLVVSTHTEHLRSLYNELERITAHIFDIGNMGGMGTGFTFMAAQGFRMVEELRRLHHTLVGHRFLRGAVTLNGAHDISKEHRDMIVKQLEKLEKEIAPVIDIAFKSDGLMERFETTGVLTTKAAEAYGASGLPARASSVPIDLRINLPYAAYADVVPALCVEHGGDVAARFRIRVRELAESIRMVRSLLGRFDAAQADTTTHTYTKGSEFGWNESWRGDIVDFVSINASGRIDRLVIRDPSFCNWPLFGELAPGNIVPDFPLCNKSLNLSYAGTDL